jgi:hypothetical protein
MKRIERGGKKQGKRIERKKDEDGLKGKENRGEQMRERERGQTEAKQRREEEQKLKEEEILEKTQNREGAEPPSNNLELAALPRGTARSAFPPPLSSSFFLCSIVSTIHMQSE